MPTCTVPFGFTLLFVTQPHPLGQGLSRQSDNLLIQMRRTVRGLAALSLCLYVYGQTDSAVGSDSPMGQLTYCLEVR